MELTSTFSTWTPTQTPHQTSCKRTFGKKLCTCSKRYHSNLETFKDSLLLGSLLPAHYISEISSNLPLLHLWFCSFVSTINSFHYFQVPFHDFFGPQHHLQAPFWFYGLYSSTLQQNRSRILTWVLKTWPIRDLLNVFHVRYVPS